MTREKTLPPPAPTHLPEVPNFPKRSRYRRPRTTISWLALLLGVIVGIGGGLYYAWVLDPVEEVNVAPWQLRPDHQNEYVVAVMLRFAYDGNLNRVVAALIEDVHLIDDPIGRAVAIACHLASTDYITEAGGLNGVLSIMRFYQSQGRRGCADEILPNPQVEVQRTVIAATQTPTLIPPPTKTATPGGNVTPTPAPNIVPTNPPQREFVIANITTFCSVEISGVIEAYVQEFNGEGIPGQAVRVRWDGGNEENIFYTGLKVERGPAYADFQMSPGIAYIIDLPGRSNPSTNPLEAAPCITDTGAEALRSYRVVFRPAG